MDGGTNRKDKRSHMKYSVSRRLPMWMYRGTNWKNEGIPLESVPSRRGSSWMGRGDEIIEIS